MANNSVPTLSPFGFLTTPAEKADALMAHAGASDKSQTRLYGDNVTSLSWLFERYSRDLGELCDNITQHFRNMFSRYFDAVDVNTSINTAASTNDNVVVISMYISFAQDGKTYSVGNELYGLNGRYDKLVKLRASGATAN